MTHLFKPGWFRRQLELVSNIPSRFHPTFEEERDPAIKDEDEARQEASLCCDNWWKDLTPEMRLFLHYQYHDIKYRMKDWPSDLAMDQHRGRFNESET